MANTSHTYLNTNAIMDNSIELNKIKTDGKVLSDNNYTTEEKEKLTGLNNKGIITELATAGNGYNVKIDWSLDPTRESTVDPAYRGQVNLGALCTTSSAYAYAEGTQNVASGNASHAEGQSTTASGSASHAEGVKTVASGNGSHAEGQVTNASGSRSHAEGRKSVASGISSHAENESTTASGGASHAEGQYAKASGQASHAEGYKSLASAEDSHVEGYCNIASGLASHAEGHCNVASSTASHAGGQSTIASGLASHTVIGGWVAYLRLTGDAGATTYTCSNISEADLAESAPYILGPDDYGYIIDIDKTHNMSPIKITSVDMSTGVIEVESTLSVDTALSDTECEVGATIAHGDYSFAARGIAAGSSAWAVNRGGFAKGTASFVGGNCNSAYNDSEVAFGHYNKSIESSDTSKAPIATIGIGTDKDNRKNAVEIMQNGDAYMIGVGGYDGTNHANATRVQDIISDCENITYSALVDKRAAGKLVPGKQYRITDYTCTTTTSGTKSAGHVFDIIVTADSESVLNEEARAIQHEGDSYFTNNNLSAWKLWYSLDNDTTRFAWADSANGKGVIYRMIDEFNNDVPYDFKNIQFYRQWNADKQLWSTISSDTTGVACYTFSSAGNSSAIEFTDMTLMLDRQVYDNTIKTYALSNQVLNNNCFFGEGCNCNIFGYDCQNNTFGNDCTNNTFGNRCNDNTIKSSCQNNTFGNSCTNNTFDNGCQNNTFGNICDNNTLGNDCCNNIFGNGCANNILGSNSSANSFGNVCQNNTFENSCNNNTFSENCIKNTFVDNCSYNTLGSGCQNIKFAPDSSAQMKNYYRNNHFGDGCMYIVFKGTEKATYSAQMQNYNFAQGLQGTSGTYLTIDGVRKRAYETKVAKNSNGVLKIYCEADLIK